MASITKFKFDIFVSYAHVDDEPADEIWVTTLIDKLKTRLAQNSIIIQSVIKS